MSVGINIQSPLSWPSRVPRCKDRKRAAFNERGRNLTQATAIDRLCDQLALIRPHAPQEIVLSYNNRIGGGRNEDPGVSLYFKLNGKAVVFPCDRWTEVPDNINAIAKHLEAMRLMERWGVGTAEQLYEGYAELPAATRAGEEWWQVLGVDGNASHEEIENAYRQLSKTAHPDVGGTNSAQARLNKAIGYYRDHIRKVGIQK